MNDIFILFELFDLKYKHFYCVKWIKNLLECVDCNNDVLSDFIVRFIIVYESKGYFFINSKPFILLIDLS